MSARSSALELAGAALLLAACRHHVKKPEADPATFVARAKTMVKTVPVPAGVPFCQPGDLVGLTMTRRTLDTIAGAPFDDAKSPEFQTWVNPPSLDVPAARVLADSTSTPLAKRQAAAELLAAPAVIVYRIDLVNAPIALGVKDPKIGTIAGRAIKYDRTGHPTCVSLFSIQDDPKVAASIIARCDHPIVPPELAKEMRDDLTAQYLKNLPRVTSSEGSAAR